MIVHGRCENAFHSTYLPYTDTYDSVDLNVPRDRSIRL
jgi:hypothetical protein